MFSQRKKCRNRKKRMSQQQIPVVPQIEASDLTEETVASERDTDLEYARTKIGHLFYRLGIFFRNLWNRLSRLWQKICRIPSSVENFTLTIQNICAKIESYQKFWNIPEQKLRFLS